jgi:hypothetical protein
LSRGLRTPPLPGTHASVGDCWQNSRCCHPLPEEQHSPSDTRVSHVGIEIPRACCRVRWLVRRFRAGPQSGSPGHVSVSPPTIPDGGISPVRFWPWLSPRRLPAGSETLRLTPSAPRTAAVCCEARPPIKGPATPARCLGPTPGPPGAQSPFARGRRYRPRRGVARPVGGRYPAVHATTDSRASPAPSHRLVGLGRRVFAGCGQPLLGAGPSRRYLCGSFLGCLDLYPGGPQGARARFFPWGVGLPRVRTGSAPGDVPHSDFGGGFDFGAAVIRSASGLRVCSPPRSLPPRRLCVLPGGRGFDVWAHLRVVAAPGSRPANRPNRAMDGVGTCTPPDPQPCRLLP